MSEQIESKSPPPELGEQLPALADQMSYYFVPLLYKRTLASHFFGMQRRVRYRDVIRAVQSLRISDFLVSPLVPERLRTRDDARRARDDAMTLWESGAEPQAHSDLHAHVLFILGHTDQRGGPRHLRLSPDGINLLTGRRGSRGPGFTLRLPPKARLRSHIESTTFHGGESALASSWEARFGVESVDLYLSPLGHGVLIIGGQFKAKADTKSTLAIPSELLLECNHTLASAGRLGASAGPLTWDEPDPEARPFSVPDLAKALLGEHPNVAPTAVPDIWKTHCERLFTYVYVNFPRPIMSYTTKLQFLTRVTRRFTSDYGVAEGADATVADSQGRNIAPPLFKNITHTATREGGACVVELGDDTERGHDVEFLRNFVTVVRTTYLPISILAYQESMFLHAQTSASVTDAQFDPTRGSTRQLGRMRSLISRTSWFRLLFRFSDIARLEHQQREYNRWRRALNLDARIQELEGDVAAAKTLLFENKRRWITLLGTGLGAFFTAKELGEMALDAMFKHADQLRIAQTQVFKGALSVAGLDELQETLLCQHRWMLVVAALVGMAACLIVWYVEFWETED